MCKQSVTKNIVIELRIFIFIIDLDILKQYYSNITRLNGQNNFSTESITSLTRYAIDEMLTKDYYVFSFDFCSLWFHRRRNFPASLSIFHIPAMIVEPRKKRMAPVHSVCLVVDERIFFSFYLSRGVWILENFEIKSCKAQSILFVSWEEISEVLSLWIRANLRVLVTKAVTKIIYRTQRKF